MTQVQYVDERRRAVRLDVIYVRTVGNEQPHDPDAICVEGRGEGRTREKRCNAAALVDVSRRGSAR